LSIRVIVTNNHRRYRPDRRKAAQYIRDVLKGEGEGKALISVVFVGSSLIRTLNRQFLHHDHVTDVLAFPLGNAEMMEGEIYVNLDRAHSQAALYRVPAAEEVARLIIHGALHLAGYNDTKRAAALRMKKAEDHYVNHWFTKKEGKDERTHR